MSLIYGLLLVTVFAFTFTATRAFSGRDKTKTTTSVVQKVDIYKNAPAFNQQQLKTIKTDWTNVILFDVPVTTETVDEALGILNTIDASRDIFLVLDSPGGSVVDGARLMNYVKYSGKKIYTVCDNFCASMAFQIFQVGKKRYMMDKAILMAHPASGGAQGTIENMHTMLSMFRNYVDRMDAEVSLRSGIEYNKFKAMVADNIWVESVDAVKMRLADDLIFLDVAVPNAFNTELNPKNSNKFISIRKRLASRGQLTNEIIKTEGYSFKFKK